MIAIPDWLMVSWDFMALGVEHILIGYDHILFILALIIGGGNKWDYVKILTAFTVGHSVTLALASLDILSIPPSIIEPLIALSIVYAAVESIVRKSRKGRWVITLLFGFIHGFGFAGILKGFLSGNYALSLFSFNLGVEIGQVIIVLIVVPLLLTVRNMKLQPKLNVGLSILISFMGMYWFIERVI
jgi:hydrogenase/urease accessory protein HupE